MDATNTSFQASSDGFGRADTDTAAVEMKKASSIACLATILALAFILCALHPGPVRGATIQGSRVPTYPPSPQGHRPVKRDPGSPPPSTPPPPPPEDDVGVPPPPARRRLLNF